MEYCELYDEDFDRIGCMFCPVAKFKTKLREKARYPQVVRAIIKAIQVLLDNNTLYGSKYGMTAEEIFDWYISNKSMKEWYYEHKKQMILPFEDRL